MSQVLMAAVGAFCVGLVGAMLGAWWLSRRLAAQWASQSHQVLQARFDAYANAQLQVLRDAAHASADAMPAPAVASSVALAAPRAEVVLANAALQGVAERLDALIASLSTLPEADGLVQGIAAAQRAAADHARASHDSLLHVVEQAKRELQVHVDTALLQSADRSARPWQARFDALEPLLEQIHSDIKDLRDTTLLRPSDGLSVDTAALADVLQSHSAAALQAQRDIVSEAGRRAEEALQLSLERIPLRVQQAIQVELQFHGQQAAERDAAIAARQQRWQDEQDERRAADCRALLYAFNAPPAATAPSSARPDAEPQRPRVRAPDAAGRPPAAVSARPPELELTPLPRPEPAPEPEAAQPELSDEELDALPPELPVPGKARKRVLPAPRNPPLRSL